MLSTETFWAFSLNLYQHNEIKQACLSLQNDFDLNVNLLLLCSFLDHNRIDLSARQFDQLRAAITPIDNQIKQIRQQRIAQKNLDQGRYKALLDQELTLEKSQQACLIAVFNKLADKAKHTPAKRGNLHTYAQQALGSEAESLNPTLASLQHNIHSIATKAV